MAASAMFSLVDLCLSASEGIMMSSVLSRQAQILHAAEHLSSEVQTLPSRCKMCP